MLQQLLSITKNVLEQEPMSHHTTFKIGGPCDYLVLPSTIEEVQNIVAFAKENGVRLTIIGNGSNLLVSDEGVDGIVLKTTELKGITVEENRIRAQAGVRLSHLCETALQNNLGGLCELSGIPGTVGGGVYMNAGAYGGEIKDTLTETIYLDQEGNLQTLSHFDHEFSYRHSVFSKHPDWVILESVFTLPSANREELKAKTVELLKQRNEKQPLELPNAGSTFQRPEGYFAGKLIEDCKLRGFCVGDAQVSQKHCGFVVNTGNATAKDIKTLIAHIKQTVQATFGVTLEAEIKYLERNNPSAAL